MRPAETAERLSRRIAVARGDEPADLVISGGRVFSVFIREWLDVDVAVADGLAAVGLGFVRGFGILRGAFGARFSHDAHNVVVVVGVDDRALALVVERLRELGGGIAVVDEQVRAELPLPVAGLLSDRPLAEVLEAQPDGFFSRSSFTPALSSSSAIRKWSSSITRAIECAIAWIVAVLPSA